MENTLQIIKTLPVYAIAAGIETRRYYEHKLTESQKEFILNIIGVIEMLALFAFLLFKIVLKEYIAPFLKAQWEIQKQDAINFHLSVKYGHEMAEILWDQERQLEDIRRQNQLIQEIQALAAID